MSIYYQLVSESSRMENEVSSEVHQMLLKLRIPVATCQKQMVAEIFLYPLIVFPIPLLIDWLTI